MIKNKRYAKAVSIIVPNVAKPKKRRLEDIINIIREKMTANPIRPDET
jgi:hypothetical protein